MSMQTLLYTHTHKHIYVRSIAAISGAPEKAKDKLAVNLLRAFHSHILNFELTSFFFMAGPTVQMEDNF